MDPGQVETAGGHRSGFVEEDRVNQGQPFEDVAALDQDPLPGGGAYARENAQRDGVCKLQQHYVCQCFDV